MSKAMDNYSPSRSEMRQGEWEWRYGQQKAVEERKQREGTLVALKKAREAIIARRCA